MFEEGQDTTETSLCEKTNCAALSAVQLRLSYSLLPQGSEREAVMQLYNRDYFICQHNDPTVMKINTHIHSMEQVLK